MTYFPPSPSWVRLPLRALQDLQNLGVFVEQCGRRQPDIRVRCFAYGEVMQCYVQLREGVVVHFLVPLAQSLTFDFETTAEIIRQSCLWTRENQVGHIDLPQQEVTFTIPWGEVTTIGVIGFDDVSRVVTAAEQILADTVTQAGDQPDPVALEQLYQALLADEVFWFPHPSDASRLEIPLRTLWMGAGLGLLSPDNDVYVVESADRQWLGVAFSMGLVWAPQVPPVHASAAQLTHPIAEAVAPDPDAPVDLLRLAEQL